MYAFFIQVLVIGCIYTYTGSIIQNWWRCTTSQSIGLVLGSAWFLLWISLVVFFGITSCVLLYDNKTNTRMLVTTVIHFKQHFDIRYFASCNLSPPRMFSSLDLLSEYRIQHGTIGPLYDTSRYSTWIFYRGVSDFATDCPCSVLCHGLTTCLLYVDPFLGNRL